MGLGACRAGEVDRQRRHARCRCPRAGGTRPTPHRLRDFIESVGVSKGVSDNPASLPYLLPYLKAAELHGSGFGSLLWASPETQATRFDAIERLGRLHGKSVLDVGCGRA